MAAIILPSRRFSSVPAAPVRWSGPPLAYGWLGRQDLVSGVIGAGVNGLTRSLDCWESLIANSSYWDAGKFVTLPNFTNFTLVLDYEPLIDSTAMGVLSTSSSANWAGINVSRNSSNLLAVSIGDDSGTNATNNCRRLTSSVTIVSGTQYKIALTFTSSTTGDWWVNGVKDTSLAAVGLASGTMVGGSGNANFFRRWNPSGGAYVYGTHRLRSVFLLPVALQDAELRDLSLNPYTYLIAAAPRTLYFNVVGGGATITGDSGTYTLSGTDVSLKAGRKLAADSGTYSLTGTAATLKVGRKLTADSGAYTLTGTAVAFKRGYALGADSGTYTVSGTSVDLKAGRKLTADSGSYTLTGTDATLTYTPLGGYTLATDSGSYTLTGSDATLRVNRRLTADSGTYTLTGADAALRIGFKLSADSGSYTLSGTDVAFSRTYVMTAGSGAYTLTGSAVGISYSGVTIYPGIEYTLPGELAHYTLPVQRNHYTILH